VHFLSFVVAAAITATPMQEMSFMSGEWSCSISSSLGHQTEIDRNAAAGAWMHVSGDVSAGMGRQASHYDGYLGWDSVQHVWVYVFEDSRGGYGAFQSAVSPRSRIQKWIGMFPKDNSGSFVLQHVSDTRYVIDFPLMVGKTKTFVHQDCRHS
jgi:Neuraminidase (sialidase)